ncbi:MAG TPA: hypothetical protein VJZ49_12290 [Syntrophales bacterium]|nr:hypothetical protein [Syntrophales bacterium]
MATKPINRKVKRDAQDEPRSVSPMVESFPQEKWGMDGGEYAKHSDYK